jgi:hypothetical protein
MIRNIKVNDMDCRFDDDELKARLIGWEDELLADRASAA